MALNGNLIEAGDGEMILNLGTLVTIKVPTSLTANQYAVAEHVLPPEGGPPPHKHGAAEVFYIISGTFEFIFGEVDHRLQVDAGSVINIPPDTIHGFKNIGDKAGKVLSIYVPGSHQDFFREAGTPIADKSSIPDLNQAPDLTGIDLDHVFALARKYGMEVIRPQK